MKLAIYDISNDGRLATVFDELNNPKFVGDKLVFDTGEISGMGEGTILLEDNDVVPDFLVDAKSLDQMGALQKEKTLQQENEELKQRVSDLEGALLAVMDLI